MGLLFASAAVIVHLVFLYAVFDVYFTSPLVHGTEPYAAHLASGAPAKRLVLFVADGLRADKCFELDNRGQPRTPFLREIIEKQGVWGISHTRVPTESRPGHVALIAGFYEDVSAVAKGWKDNPVLFDSVFNKSRLTWSWGSPDILPMFSKGVADGHVMTHTYAAEVEDFAGKELYRLDTWVFAELENFIRQAEQNRSLMLTLHQDKIVFFLHLLGIDTNGHAHKPDSEEYLENIRIMDEGIRNVTSILENFFGDEKTAYIMTSDHGMTNWGSHGTGHAAETLTPFVSWGAGLRRPTVAFAEPHRPASDSQCAGDRLCDADRQYDVHKWNLSSVKREDLDQADVAPLMAALLGLEFPANSVGLLRTALLNMTDHDKAQSLLANARQVAAQFKVKEELVQQQTLRMLFKPFRATSLTIQARLQAASEAIALGEYSRSEGLASDVVSDSLAGLTYYHKYDRTFLGVCLTLGFAGWMAYTATTLLSNVDQRRSSCGGAGRGAAYRSLPLSAIFLAVRIAVALLLFVQSSPWSYYVYSLGPTWLWEAVIKKCQGMSANATRISWCAPKPKVGLSLLLLLLLICLGLELTVLSFFCRELLSVGLVCLACVPWLQLHSTDRHHASMPPRRRLFTCWSAACIALAIFPLLPVVGRNTHYNFVLLSACCASVSFYAMARMTADVLLKYQSAVVLIAGLVVKWTSLSIEAKEGLPTFCQAFSWILLGSTFVIPLASSLKPTVRLNSLSASFVALYLTFSISHEAFFICVLTFFLVTWYHMEDSRTVFKITHSLSTEGAGQSILQSDAQLAFFFIYTITVGFFGTGNIASLNSFEPASVYCFLTVFSPFLMGGLMLLKVILPFLLISCAFSIILHNRNGACHGGCSAEHVFLIILLMSDFMGLHFFFLVKDEGSWLDIGTSISHYVIALSTTIVLLVFYEAARFMTSASLRWLSWTSSFSSDVKVHGID